MRALLLAAAGLIVGTAAGAEAIPERPCVHPSSRSRSFDPTRIRGAIVNRIHEREDTVLAAVRTLGANTLVTNSNPDPETARAARTAGLFYIAAMTTDDLERAESDPAFRALLESAHPLAGVYYEDDRVLEGYTDVESQAVAYARVKKLYPCALALHPTRLDLIAWDPGFLSGYFRPDFTDLVTPYYYPVGTTTLGTAVEEDPWEPRLESLLLALAARVPAGMGVLPVLQGYEQVGFPVSSRFPSRQMNVYARVWPENQNAAALHWGRTALDSPLVGFGFLPELQNGLKDLFHHLAGAVESPRVVARSR